MFAIYTFMMTAALVLGGPYFLFKLLISKKWRAGFSQRLGFGLPMLSHGSIWLQASSVGEVKIAARLIRDLELQYPQVNFVVTVMTRTGFVAASKVLSPKVMVLYAPLDFPPIVRKFLTNLRPVFLGLVETELWPHLIHYTHQRGSKIGILNGRVSDSSFPHYRRWRGLFQRVLADVDFACAQTELDKGRLRELGLDPQKIHVCSSIKYDLLFDREKRSGRIFTEFGLAPDALVWTAGSTRNGEEELLLKVYQELKKSYPQLVFIIAPRHLERVGEIKKLLGKKGIEYVLKTDISSAGKAVSSGCILLDQMGELWRAYSIATVVFVGGSLVAFGGQNILEPVSMGKPVVFGRYMENFKEISQYLLAKNGAIQISNTAELTVTLQRLLASPAERAALAKRGENSLERKRGALQKNIEEIKKYVSVK